jgi:hypothetical protein
MPALSRLHTTKYGINRSPVQLPTVSLPAAHANMADQNDCVACKQTAFCWSHMHCHRWLAVSWDAVIAQVVLVVCFRKITRISQQSSCMHGPLPHVR